MSIAATVRHYETHLAPIYVWMAGGVDHAVSLGRSDVADYLDAGGYAVDLGAGFGMHTIALARSRYRVLAIDTSQHLLAELQRHCAGLAVDAVVADLLGFPDHMSGKADLVLCMGDTLTHLESEAQVVALMRDVASALHPGGRFITTFRDYRHLPRAADRFIHVRSDAERILTCFLEEVGEHVLVHDVLHERNDGAWTMKVSSYQKLRLSPHVVVDAARSAGLSCDLRAGPRGMVEIRANA